jgi:hypothetical protein
MSSESGDVAPYVLWLGALSAVCGLVILKSRQDSKLATTGATRAALALAQAWQPPR